MIIDQRCDPVWGRHLLRPQGPLVDRFTVKSYPRQQMSIKMLTIDPAEAINGVPTPNTILHASNRIAPASCCKMGTNKMSTLKQRKSIRLKDYDYSQPGAYFVTICTYHRLHLFGEIENSNMILNELGRLVESEIASRFSDQKACDLDSSVVMPNHLHAIIVINQSDRPNLAPLALGQMIRGFKAGVTRTARMQNIISNTTFMLWQDRYHDHIIRDETALNNIRNYIAENPARWQDDTFFG